MKKLFLLSACCLLSACAKNLNSDTYVSSSVAGKVLEGTVISARQVTVKDHDKLQDNTAGGLVGGGAGALAGSQIGRGGGSIAGAIGGAIIGAVAGAVVEDQLGTQQGMEYLVKIDKKYLEEYHTLSKKIQSNGKSNVEQDMTATTIATKTDIVSVVETGDAAIHKGSRVYIIYSDDRPRLEPQDAPEPAAQK